jgi:hypothetical protein
VVKNKVLILTGILLLIIACNVFAQSNNNQQKIIGTWVASDGTTCVFNANGTCNFDGENARYFVIESKLFIKKTGKDAGRDAEITNFDISFDGKILVLYLYVGEFICLWLDKK